jgi:C4-dicarboxylate transporter, DctM subunit
MSDATVGIIGMCVLMLLFLMGVEMAFAMIIVGFFGFAALVTLKGAMNMIAKDFYDTFASYGLTVVPLFVLMGQVAFNAGIAKRLYDCVNRFMGHIPGGLSLATVAGVTVFKSICGSAMATTATFASVAVPEMDRFQYNKKLSTGVVAVSGTLGILLPPSVVLIMFGMLTEQSIGKLFLAGLIPGLLLAALFAAVIIVWCRVDPTVGPKSTKHTWKERLVTVPAIAWPLLIFAVMIGGLMFGVFTPTEAGSVGALCVILLVFFKGDLKFRGFLKSVVESLRTASMVLTLFAASIILGRFIAATNIPAIAADWAVSLPVHRNIIMCMIFVIFLLGGSIIDDIAFMVLATPIFFPVVSKLGFDPLWSGIIICLTVVVGGVIPPVAMNVFIVKNITKVPIGVIYKGVYPFLIGMILMIVLLFLFPQIVTFLPYRLMG